MSATAGAPLLLSHPAFDPKRRQVFVVGNEAADVDSLVSAFAVAQLLDSTEVEAVALAQIPRKEFRFRGDGLHLFQRAGCDLAADGTPRSMRFWDEVDWSAVRSLESRQLVLTDHNKMTAKVADNFEPARVTWVLDHHADERLYTEAQRDLDESLGSACTLVQEQFVKAGREVPPQLGLLLLGVILLDSRNFDAKEGWAGNPRDSAAVEQLARFLPEIGQDAWYAQLKDARRDVSHLSAKEQFMIDMKVSRVDGFEGNVAFCTLTPTLDEIVAMAGSTASLLATMQEYAFELGCKGVIAGCFKDKDGFKGLVAVPASEADQAMIEAVVARLAGAPGNLPLELRENPLYAKQGILDQGFGLQPRADLEPLKGFRMRGVISRKTLMPRAVTEALAG